MEKTHISKKQKVLDYLKQIEHSIDKKNVEVMLLLLDWTIKKIGLINIAEKKKQEAKILKSQGKPPPKPLKVSRGEIWEVNLGFNIGSEESGSRPALIVQNDLNNKTSHNVIVIPLTKIENRVNGDTPLSLEEFKVIESKLRPTEALLYVDDVKEGESKLIHPSIVLCQNIITLSKERLVFKITAIKDICWKKINEKIKFSLNVD